MNYLTDKECFRYTRQIQLSGFGKQSQEKLKQSRVLIVGVGGLGCPVAQTLISMGVGTIGLIDFDTVEVSNLHRQMLYTENDVGKLKVDCAKSRLQSMNHHASINTYPTSFDQNTSSVVDEYDLVIDGTDRIELRYLLNAVCRNYNKGYLFAGINTWSGMTALFTPNQGPCYQCLYPDKPPSHMLPKCTEGGVLGVLPGIIGSIQAAEAVSYLTGVNEECIVHHFNLKSMEMKSFALKKDPACPICRCDDHQVPEIIPEITYRQLENMQAQLIDVRQPEEHAQGALDGSILIPLDDLPSKIDALSRDSNIVCYCQHGIRSMYAAEYLKGLGFEHVYSLKGGIEHIINVHLVD